MTSTRFRAGERFPPFRWEAVFGPPIAPAEGNGWRLLIVYRGRHCNSCRAYLGTLDAMLGDFAAAGISVAAVSADAPEKARAQLAETGWKIPIGCGLAVAQMRELGIYVSEPLSAEENDRPFAEPATFVLNPEGLVQVVQTCNAPFARPELQALLKGIQYIRTRSSPIRGRG